ncbi:T-cell receptor alpha chain V region HPB-MLT [Tupaia chinensis]|nr:T-cell receptor alpha chain V region HPB-MLT [Tupaia chinensis]
MTCLWRWDNLSSRGRCEKSKRLVQDAHPFIPFTGRYDMHPAVQDKGMLCNQVTQSSRELAVASGSGVVLPCTYSTSYSNPGLYWYREKPDGTFQFILYRDNSRSLNAEFTKGRFSVKRNQNQKTFHLVINPVRMEDSALYFCALSTVMQVPGKPAQKPTGTAQWSYPQGRPNKGMLCNQVTQSSRELAVASGSGVVLPCTYSTSYSNPGLYWYREKPDGTFQFILYRDNSRSLNAEFTKGRFSVKRNQNQKTFHLVINPVRMEDSALYFCALSTVMQVPGKPAQKPTGTAQWSYPQGRPSIGSGILLLVSMLRLGL